LRLETALPVLSASAASNPSGDNIASLHFTSFGTRRRLGAFDSSYAKQARKAKAPTFRYQIERRQDRVVTA
jgi:hypothetical protein